MSSEGTAPAEQQSRIQVDYHYIKYTWFGRLRITELFASLLCAICVSSVYSLGACHLTPAAFGFHRFVAWTTWINLLVFTFIRVLGFHRRLLECYHRVEIHLLLCVIATVAFFVSSCIVAAVTHCPHTPAQQVGAGFSVFFGFVCMFLFGAESYLHFVEYRGGAARDTEATEPAEPIPDSDIVKPGII